MANTKTWPDPDTQVAQQGRADVHGVYLLDPATQKAVSPTNVTATSTPDTSNTAALTAVAGSASSVQLLAANNGRKSYSVFNDSTANMYLAEGATSSTTAYKVKLVSYAYYEMPASPIWTGAVSAIWDSATGNARISEDT